MNRFGSGPCQPPGEESDLGDEKPSLGAGELQLKNRMLAATMVMCDLILVAIPRVLKTYNYLAIN